MLFPKVVAILCVWAVLGTKVPRAYGFKHFGHHHGGYGHGYGYSDELVVHKPVLVSKPVLVKQPAVSYKKVHYKLPPPSPPPPIWVKKPVIHNVKEWRLVDVPKVTYKSVLVHPTPYYHGGYAKHGKFSKFFKKFNKFKW